MVEEQVDIFNPPKLIADEIKRPQPEEEILILRDKGKMEKEKVPKAGYPIEGLWISGYQRTNLKTNLSYQYKIKTRS
ncbi:hypothetical protein ACQ1PN_12025 [Ornithobacterium rhinotracheale]